MFCNTTKRSKQCHDGQASDLDELGFEQHDHPPHDLAVSAVFDEHRDKHVAAAASEILDTDDSVQLVGHGAAHQKLNMFQNSIYTANILDKPDHESRKDDCDRTDDE